jgi:hypothetical protein
MHEDPKRTDPDPTSDFILARSIDATRSDNDIGNSKAPAILSEDLLLPDLPKTIGFPAKLGMLFDWARFL